MARPPLGAEVLAATDGPPLVALLAVALHGAEHRHLELMAEAGFDDVRRAHNAVLANLPADGARLTELAEAAGITKQAMAELVDDLVAKGYVAKVADPTDGRAKRIVWAERGEAAHRATLAAFATIDAEVAAVVGADGVARLRRLLGAAAGATAADKAG